MPLLIHHQYHSFAVAVCALLTGLLLGCSFPPVDCTILAWVSLVPLGVVLNQRRLTPEIWSGVYLGGLLYHLIAMSWLKNLYGEVDYFSDLSVVILVLSQIETAIYCFSFWITHRAIAKLRAPICLCLPLFWVAFEWLRILVAFTIEPAMMPWLRLGGTQVEWLTFAQIARLGGEGTLTLLVALVNGWLFAVLYEIWARGSNTERRSHWTLVMAPIAMLITIAYGCWSLYHIQNYKGPCVALMGRENWLLDPQLSWQHGGTAKDDSSQTPDLLIWPELADHHKLISVRPAAEIELPGDVRRLAELVPGDYGTWYRHRLANAAANANAAVLVGCERVDLTCDKISRYNSVAFADPHKGFLGFCDKQSLAPVMERKSLAASWLGLSAARTYSPGTVSPLFTLDSATGPQKFACLICYDIAYPIHIKNLDRKGEADFFVHCGSESADPTGCLSKTLFRMARLRAIEAQRPIIRSCHGGASGVIDAAGRFTPCPNNGHTSANIVKAFDVLLGHHAGAQESLFRLASCLLVVGCVAFPWAKAKVTARKITCSHSKENRRTSQTGFSLLELMAVVAILGTVTAVIVPRVSVGALAVKQKCDAMNRSQINAAVERYYLIEGDWPENDLNDIGTNPEYFPNGIPLNPVTNTPYQLNATTHRVMASGGGGGGK